MKKGLFIFVLIGICTVGANHSFAQGCSDAGFCTINSFKPNNADSIGAMKNQFKIGAFYGQADYSISVYGSYLEYNRQVSKKLGLDARLTTLAQNGNGISTFGVSDFFINANYKLNKKLKFTLGMKKGGKVAKPPVKKMAKGGSVSSRADGCAVRGKTRGKIC